MATTLSDETGSLSIAEILAFTEKMRVLFPDVSSWPTAPNAQALKACIQASFPTTASDPRALENHFQLALKVASAGPKVLAPGQNHTVHPELPSKAAAPSASHDVSYDTLRSLKRQRADPSLSDEEHQLEEGHEESALQVGHTSAGADGTTPNASGTSSLHKRRRVGQTSSDYVGDVTGASGPSVASEVQRGEAGASGRQQQQALSALASRHGSSHAQSRSDTSNGSDGAMEDTEYASHKAGEYAGEAEDEEDGAGAHQHSSAGQARRSGRFVKGHRLLPRLASMTGGDAPDGDAGGGSRGRAGGHSHSHVGASSGPPWSASNSMPVGASTMQHSGLGLGLSAHSGGAGLSVGRTGTMHVTIGPGGTSTRSIVSYANNLGAMPMPGSVLRFGSGGGGGAAASSAGGVSAGVMPAHMMPMSPHHQMMGPVPSLSPPHQQQPQQPQQQQQQYMGYGAPPYMPGYYPPQLVYGGMYGSSQMVAAPGYEGMVMMPYAPPAASASSKGRGRKRSRAGRSRTSLDSAVDAIAAAAVEVLSASVGGEGAGGGAEPKQKVEKKLTEATLKRRELLAKAAAARQGAAAALTALVSDSIDNLAAAASAGAPATRGDSAAAATAADAGSSSSAAATAGVSSSSILAASTPKKGEKAADRDGKRSRSSDQKGKAKAASGASPWKPQSVVISSDIPGAVASIDGRPSKSVRRFVPLPPLKEWEPGMSRYLGITRGKGMNAGYWLANVSVAPGMKAAWPDGKKCATHCFSRSAAEAWFESKCGLLTLSVTDKLRPGWPGEKEAYRLEAAAGYNTKTGHHTDEKQAAFSRLLYEPGKGFTKNSRSPGDGTPSTSSGSGSHSGSASASASSSSGVVSLPSPAVRSSKTKKRKHKAAAADAGTGKERQTHKSARKEKAKAKAKAAHGGAGGAGAEAGVSEGVGEGEGEASSTSASGGAGGGAGADEEPLSQDHK